MEINEKAKVLFGRKHKNSFKSDLPFLALLLPAMIVTLIFAYLPMVGLVLAFEDFDMFKGYLSPLTDHFGFGHFITIFSEPSIFEAIWNTFYLNLLGLVINFPAPLIFALLLDEVTRKGFKRTVQTISYLPYFLSWISVTGLAINLLSLYGSINNLLSALGFGRVRFLENLNNFVPIYLILTVWKGVGWGSIIYLSNISSINSELYESAQLDGANRFRQVWHITLPALLPTAMILLILNVGQMFGSNFELVYGLQSNYFDKEVISTWVYRYGLRDGDYSLSTALTLLQSVVALVLTLGANKISDKVSSVSMW